MYRVSRVAHAMVLPAVSPRAAGFDLAAVWAGLRDQVERPRGEPVTVTLRADADVAPMVLRVCAPHFTRPVAGPVPDVDVASMVLCVCVP